jgi:hypothetical protein
MYGIFAALPKVSLLSDHTDQKSDHTSVNEMRQTTTPAMTKTGLIPSRTSTGMKPPMATNLNKKLSGSQESITSEKSSVYSTASAAVNKPSQIQQISTIKKPLPVKQVIRLEVPYSEILNK